jgi:hypothetical protein
MSFEMDSPNPTKRSVLNKLFDVDKVLLKECGSVYGGIMIFHPYRIIVKNPIFYTNIFGQNTPMGENCTFMQ